MFRPLSTLSSRLPQLFSWFYDPNDLTDRLVPKQRKPNQPSMIGQIQANILSYIPPVYVPPKPSVKN